MSGAQLEVTSSYSLVRSASALAVPERLPPCVHAREAAHDNVDCSERAALAATKSRLDALPQRVYYSTRDTLFPLAHSGGNARFKNRAAHKLNECMEAASVWPALRALGPTCAFADVCGGPGSFTQALYGARKQQQLKLRGFGMTLMHAHADAPRGWYPELFARHKFVATFGIDGTGNIYENENVMALRSIVAQEPLRLVVADGGFDVPSALANFQEVISNRIVFGQWYCAIKLLRAGGCLVLKLFDTFAPFTRSVLYLSTFAFDVVKIVKPRHSRIVNSERYLVCVGFTGLTEEWLLFLDRFHKHAWPAAGTGPVRSDDTTPFSVVPPEVMEQDAAFMRSVKDANTDIAARQCEAIELLLCSTTLAEKLREHEENSREPGAKRAREEGEGEGEGEEGRAPAPRDRSPESVQRNTA